MISWLASRQNLKRKKIKECSDFQAGNSLRSKVKNSKLSETAVFGSVCRHEFPQSIFSLRHGERLGYPIYMTKHFLEKQSTSDTKIHITYDIACLLAKHIKGNPSYASMLEKIILSIPVFHCYGHQYSCQDILGKKIMWCHKCSYKNKVRGSITPPISLQHPSEL